MASSFPPIAGIFTAIVGGLVASFLGSSRLSIKGPAAGLIVILIGAIQELGQGDLAMGYKRCLAACAAAAILQIIFSRIGAGKVGSLMPPSVIHGMLAAIGIIIIAKQIHILVGVSPHSKSPLDLIAEIPNSILNTNPEIALIGFLTISTIVFLPFIPSKITKKFPPALIALVMVLPLAIFWHLDSLHSYFIFNHTYEVGPKFLVELPNNILNSITFPDFSSLTSFVGWKYVIMLALVGSLESLLTVSAIDSLDPKKQKSNLDSDLFSVGVGNLICSMIGGLPMISEVVRSKANIDNGAQTQWSNFFHGVFLLLAVTLLTGIIHEIPLAALAAMLIITGFRLSSPHEFYKTYRIGFDQLFIFVATLLITLKVDLLVGVFAGLLLKMGLHLMRGVKIQHLFTIPIKITDNKDTILVSIEGAAIFSNFLHLNKKLQDALSTNKKVIVDFSQTNVVDHTTMSRLRELEKSLGSNKLSLTGLHLHKPVSNHDLATHKLA